ncbi:lycopene epsilon cyclase chloroplastic [Phtheirospermum japonicum]|uniref:Lycopene epsilon cyclase chloroplastic n=1 Tax=Phtheirospermum japonicum TaxID=374723 RepID=A0A830BPF4_9LAMI|nr:lycopene epsilon cyclase chloroplastic [Phtheirospermum japonicum]
MRTHGAQQQHASVKRAYRQQLKPLFEVWIGQTLTSKNFVRLTGSFYPFIQGKSEDLYARLVVLFHNLLEREQLVTHILTCHRLYSFPPPVPAVPSTFPCSDPENDPKLHSLTKFLKKHTQKRLLRAERQVEEETMESLAARNLAAMAVSVYPICIVAARVPGARAVWPVPVKEDFADEKDYVKAGGSEIFFIQMQQNKTMDQHSKLSDKHLYQQMSTHGLQLPRIFTGDNVLDLVVIGCGPAGLTLAAESAKLGLNVGLVGPDLPFTNNYGVWEDEFKDLGLERCIDHVWRDTIVYLDENDPIFIGRAYGRVSRHLLHEELLKRCVESGVSYLNTKVERVFEASSGHRLVKCEGNIVIPCRLAVASGASGKLLEYEVGGPRVSVQTAYGVEVEVENNPYDPSLMVFMDYRDFMKCKLECVEAQYPTFLYTMPMPMSPTRVNFEETCLASKDAMPSELLKCKLMSRLETIGIRIIRTYEEEWSYIPVGGSLPNTEQKNLAFGAAASMVHPATGYSVVRSLSEAPNYASVIANILKQSHVKNMLVSSRISDDISMQAWNALWPLERKR